MNTLLLWLSGLLILVLAALFAVPSFIDWNAYRSVFEAQATKLVGRTVSVQGDVNLRLLPAPYVSFERVEVADAAGTAPLLTVQDYTLWLAVPPLLQGEIEAQAMEISQPKLRLALSTDGTGNWAGIGGGDFELPFVPRNVAFNAMNIRDAAIEIVDPQGNQLLNVTQLSGTLSARALKGPYKFTGEIANKTDARELRWSTGRLDENDAIRIKGTLKDNATGATFAADGLLQKITSRPVFTGAVAGKLKKKDAPGFEMKTDVYMDTAGAQLSDITLLIDSDGRPQIINGSGRTDWHDGARAELNFNSRWLDIDRLVSTGRERPLFDLVDEALSFVHEFKLGSIAATTVFEAAQVNLGGELLDDMTVKLTRRGGETTVERLAANLPGSSQLEMTGRISKPAEAFAGEIPSFHGKMQLRGRSLSRLAQWIDTSLTPAATAADGAFSLESAVTFVPDTAALQDMRGTVRGTRFSGRVWKDRTAGGGLSLALSSAEVDLTPMFPDAASFSAYVWRWMEPERSGSETAAPASQDRLRIANVNLALGQVKVGQARYSDVTVDIANPPGDLSPAKSRNLVINKSAFVSDTGLSFEIEGHMSETKEASKADLKFIVRAPSVAAVDELKELGGGRDGATTFALLPDAAAPLHLAGSLRYGQADDPATLLRFDGTMAGNPTKGRIIISGNNDDVFARNWNFAADMNVANVGKSLKYFGLENSRDQNKTPVQGRLIGYAIGAPNKGLKATIGLKSEHINATFDGSVATASGADFRFDGTVSGTADRIDTLADLTGLGSDGVDNRATTFNGKIVHVAGKTTFDDVRVAIGDVSASGRASLISNGRTYQIALNADVDRLSFPGVLSAIAGTGGTKVTGERGGDHIWPDTPFDFSRLDGIELQTTLRASHLGIGGELELTNATLDLSASPDGITLTSLQGAAANGQIGFSGVLERQPAGAALQLAGQGSGIDVALLAPVSTNSTDPNTSSAPSSGTMSFKIDLEGRGLSPLGITSVAIGRGQVDVNGAKLPRFSPQLVQDVAADLAEANIDIETNDLKHRLTGRLADRSLDLGRRTVGLRIRDGALQTDDLTISTDAATIKASTFIDLGKLRLDSEWRVTPKAAPGSAPLPPVTVFFAGDIRNLDGISPGFGVAALERELAVRRLEGNIDLLEGVRSLKLKKRKKQRSGSLLRDQEQRHAGTLRPTIGAKASRQAAPMSIPPEPQRVDRPATGLWDVDEGGQPPIELELQTPQGANPT